ncbi:hypothetical protein D1BOALGB6SA_9442 [Olavius sp. associated proteobacterium Delta 1]|nr:hypothetical protein D1BOALGB6SA_9442 [Olavius sp. associated proteobacterium Delta 1]
MRILYFSFVELDVPNACRTHTLGVLKGLSQNGCQADAVLPRPKSQLPVIGGINFHCIWPWRFSTLGKWWVINQCGLFFFIRCLFKKYQAIYVRELENNPVPRVISKIFNIPLFIEINDLLPAYFGTIVCSQRFVSKVKENQLRDFKQARGLIANSIPMKTWIEEKYPFTQGKVNFIMNGCDPQIENRDARASALRTMNLDGTGFYLGFVGSVYERFDLITPIIAMRRLAEVIPGIKFIIIGDGPQLIQLKQFVGEKQLTERVVFTGFIQETELHRYLPAFDAAIIPLTKISTELYGSLPSKFATYLSFKLPVITTSSDLSAYPAEIQKWVFRFEAENLDGLVKLLSSLYHDRNLRQEAAGRLNQFFIDNLTWQDVARRIAAAISK